MSPAPAPPVARVDLQEVLRRAAVGRFPAADGGFSRAVPWRSGVEAAVAFTGHAVLVVGEDVPDERLVGLGVHGYGGAHDPRVTLALAGDGEVGVLDVLLVGRGRPATTGPLVVRPDLATLSRGIAGLPEVGLQADAGGAGRLLEGVLGAVPEGEVVLASVTPGNARSLRFFLRHGFVPVGSVQQWRPRR